ncbi:hypothetical protein FA531_28720, partial [Pseudomonas aeruginosa]|nr:hypothetical protein [Pseudomonas aeruginosa]
MHAAAGRAEVRIMEALPIRNRRLLVIDERQADRDRVCGLLQGTLARISHRKRCTGPSDARKLLCKERFSATTESGPMQTQCNPKQ